MHTLSAQETAIRLEHVSQVFGGFAALRDVSLEMPAGSSAVLLGENGAGKSTLLRLLAGLATPTFGQVRVWGTRPRDLLGRIGYLGHAAMLYDELSGHENLLYFARLSSLGPVTANLEEQVTRALQNVGLDPRSARRVGEYSQGMRQRASLARVLLGNPDLLLLDEPFSNLDAASSELIVSRLHAFLAEPGMAGLRRTLVLTTHQVELARPLAQLRFVLRSGSLLPGESGSPSPSAAPESTLPTLRAAP